MSLFSGWNQLTTGLNQVSANLSGFNNAFSTVTGNLNQAVSQAVQQFNSSSIGQTVNTVRGLNEDINRLLSAGGLTVNNVGTNQRMISNAFQGVSTGASPAARQTSPAIAVQDIQRSDVTNPGDWRVSLSVPSVIAGGPVLEPLSRTGNRMVFPFTPSVLLQNEANYTSISPTHTNYPYQAYQSSSVSAITITGDFVNENQEDGEYYIAVIHFLRTMTKMFYGNGDNLGNPPLTSRLNGYGRHVLNDIPVVITNFSMDLQPAVDYIECNIGGESNYVPVESMITVTCVPNYSRRAVSQFNLNEFAKGAYVGAGQGFI